jgi:hypothetical protein
MRFSHVYDYKEIHHATKEHTLLVACLFAETGRKTEEKALTNGAV